MQEWVNVGRGKKRKEAKRLETILVKEKTPELDKFWKVLEISIAVTN